MGIKRLIVLCLLALAAAAVFVPGAAAGNFDEVRMGCSGENPATCPAGQVGQPYSLKVLLEGDEDTGCAVVRVSSGSLPPGLGITQQFNETNAAIISGTPTAAGNFAFFLTVDYTAAPSCSKPASDDRFVIPINPSVPKLILQPEQSGVPVGTVAAPYSLQMTSNLADAKTFSISSGALPPGLALNSSTGLISGVPTAAGTFSFTVLASINNDPHKRSDTKALAVTVREQVAIVAPASVPAFEVTVPVDLQLTASGGTGTFTWALTSGTLPRGVIFGPDGSISGTPRRAGTFQFIVTVTDTEGRTATYEGLLTVQPKIRVIQQRLGLLKAGKKYRYLLKTRGGVNVVRWEITAGALPLGVRLASKKGILVGKPRKAGRYRFTIEVTDALQVKHTRTFVMFVRAAPAKKKKRG